MREFQKDAMVKLVSSFFNTYFTFATANVSVSKACLQNVHVLCGNPLYVQYIFFLGKFRWSLMVPKLKWEISPIIAAICCQPATICMLQTHFLHFKVLFCWRPRKCRTTLVIGENWMNVHMVVFFLPKHSALCQEKAQVQLLSSVWCGSDIHMLLHRTISHSPLTQTTNWA